MNKVYYNSYLLDPEVLDDIDSIIQLGLSHVELEGKKYTDMVSGDDALIDRVIDILHDGIY